MSQAPKITAATVLAVVMTVMVGVGLVAGTDAGTRWLIERLDGLLPGQLSAQQLQGNLLAGVNARQVVYRTEVAPFVTVTVDDVNARVSFWDLLDARIGIERLKAAELRVDVETVPDASAEPFAGFSVPLAIRADSLEIDALTVTVNGVVTHTTGVSVWGSLEGSDLDVVYASASSAGYDVELQGVTRFEAPFPIELALDWSYAGAIKDALGGALAEQLPLLLIAAPRGAGRLEGTLESLQINQRLYLPELITATGTLKSALTAPRLQASAEWSELGRSVNGTPLQVRDTTVSIDTDFETYRLKAVTDLTAADYPPAHVDATLTGAARHLDVEALLLSSPAGQLVVSGSADFASGVAALLAIQARDVDPSEFAENLSGLLHGDAELDVQSSDEVTLRASSVHGEFLGNAFRAAATAHWRNGAIDVQTAQVESGDARVELSGTVYPELDTAFAIDADDLSNLWPDLTGRVDGDGSIVGHYDAPRVSTRLRGADLTLGSLNLNTLTVNADSNADGTLAWQAEARGLASAELELGDLTVALTGRVDNHVLTAAWRRGAAALDIESRGGFDDNRLTHVLRRGRLIVGEYHDWSLGEPMPWQAGVGGVEFAAHCWHDDDASICVEDSQLTADRSNAELAIRNFSLRRLQHVLDEDLRLTGTVDAEVALVRTPDALDGRLSWRQHDTQISYEDIDGRTVATRFDEILLTGEASGASAAARLAASSDDGDRIEGAIEITDPASLTGALAGRVRLESPELARWTPLITRFIELDDVIGKLKVELAIGGTVAAPRFTGNALIEDASASVPVLGINLDDLQIKLDGSADGLFTVTGAVRSGPGQATLTGTADLLSPDGWTAQLALAGEDFEVVRFAERRMRVSPDVQANISGQLIRLDGRVYIPYARIELDELPETVDRPSRDVVIHGEVPLSGIDDAVDVVGNLTLTLGDDVRFKGFGLDTGLRGELKFDQQRHRAIRGDGRLRLVDGRFAGFGLDLAIDRGSLVFSGPLDNPSLDVRATRSLTYEGRDMVAGLMLTGRVDTMQTRVFTEPGSSQVDALSYLILSRPAYAGPSGDSDGDLTAAALSLGLQQALPFTRTAGGIGLEEIGIEGSGDEDRSVVAGVRLSDDLSLRYHYGLFNRLGTILVRYRLARGFSIEAGSGEVHSLDLIYSFDR